MESLDKDLDIKTPKNSIDEDFIRLVHTPPSISRQKTKFLKSLSGNRLPKSKSPKELLNFEHTSSSSSSSNFFLNRVDSPVTNKVFHYLKNSNGIDSNNNFTTYDDNTKSCCTKKNEPTNLSNKRKINLPTPLNLDELTPPPSNSKNLLVNYEPIYPGKLDLPLSFSKKAQNQNTPILHHSRFSSERLTSVKHPRRNLARELGIQNGNVVRKGNNAHDKGMYIDNYANKYDISMFDEKEVIAYTEKLNKNISRHASEKTKNYTMNMCCICKEPLNILLSGEKPIELECGHQAHYNCLFTVAQSKFSQYHHAEREADECFVTCSICLDKTFASDQNVRNELFIKILGTENSFYRDNEIAEQKKHIKTPPEEDQDSLFTQLSNFHFSNNNHSDEKTFTSDSLILNNNVALLPSTPVLQLIKTPLVKSDGFLKTPVKLQNKMVKTGYNFEINFKPVVHVIPMVSKLKISRNINEDLSKCVVSYVLNVFLPNNDGSKSTAESITDGVDGTDEETIKLHISNKIIENWNLAVKKSWGEKIHMFDIMDVNISDNWEENTIVILFDNFLTLLKLNNFENIGKIPINEISRITFLEDENTIIIDLKSSSTPEILLKHEFAGIIVKKWAIYLQELVYNAHLETAKDSRGGFNFKVPLIEMTTNCLDILDPQIVDAFPQGIRTVLEDYPNNDVWYDFANKFGGHKKVRKVLCLSVLNRGSPSKNLELEKNLQKLVRVTLENLNEQDELGIVIIGKNGSGQPSTQGTFLGLVSKKWGGWDDFIISIKVINDQHNLLLNSHEAELESMVDTCHKLLLFSGICQEDSDSNRNSAGLLDDCDTFSKDICIVINGNSNFDYTDGIKSKNLTRKVTQIFNEYGFNITQYSLFDSCLNLNKFMEDIGPLNARFKSYNFESFNELIRMVSSRGGKSTTSCISDIQLGIQAKGPNVKILSIENSYSHKVNINSGFFKIDVGNLEVGEFRNYLLDVVYEYNNHGSAYDEVAYMEKSLINVTPEWELDHSKIAGETYDSIAISFATNVFTYTSYTEDEVEEKGYNRTARREGEDDFYTNLILAAPLTSSTDSMYVLRQIELMVVELLEKKLNNFNDLATLEDDLKQTISIIFGKARNCICGLTSFYKELGQGNKFFRLDDRDKNRNITLKYVELLSDEMDSIINSWKQQNRRTTLFKMKKLLDSLKFQTKFAELNFYGLKSD
ncbi:cyclin-dependent protein serine/threonine kinase inhibiting protein FAR1 SCDLUD_002593 [Saccharomycodes ludwigii]|uniref:cyclin-dependent protein serine/threonine kinase inhibiting protein FAR1 n=1 Tax=Saccharomycodes ludwigii TaxID=36035 RepID=UPI001E84CFB9|nr:hypothetical protein SCDLUD_002593 [Saccharomycodes ludwigii]KAH3901113.1 hypothetical protein SCDLUD_002593 [Saccharomycodes ludwigii]